MMSVQDTRVHMRIFAAFVAIIVMALPVWWYLTTIERLPLPTERVRAYQERGTCPVTNAFQLCVDEPIGTDTVMDTLSEISYMEELAGVDEHLCLDISFSDTCDPIPSLEPPRDIQRPLRVPIENADDASQKVQKYMARYLGLPCEHVQQCKNRTAEDARVISYAPRLRLVFSLLQEDASRGHAVHTWDLPSALETMEVPALAPLRRILDAMAPVHSIELESQIQWYAPLEFEPKAETWNEKTVHIASMDDVRVFINSPQWSLESYSTHNTSTAVDERTLHFVLFLPSELHTPLYVKKEDQTLVEQPAWLVPQWGGVVVWNRADSLRDEPLLTLDELQEPVRLFTQQLTTLLGIEMEDVDIDDHEALAFAVEGLQWRRTLEMARGAVETLASIDRLVRKILNLGVNERVRDTFIASLDLLDACDASLQGLNSSVSTALSHASDAYQLASQSFYDPSMLAMLYFPEEHKYAVYFPLFGPLFLPLLIALVREIKHRRARRSVEARDS
ncbi:GPI transamidase component [Malassezia equina]|uniref:GPI transamidase component n=1 Tax=Malassezia equina TaxID=1381935 RepID=A0AAF0EHL5_9BASI|nr:GPI transamidase component [Malassezia equina]